MKHLNILFENVDHQMSWITLGYFRMCRFEIQGIQFSQPFSLLPLKAPRVTLKAPLLTVIMLFHRRHPFTERHLCHRPML